MAWTNWEADKMLDVYIHDYFVKRNLHATARAFQAERGVPKDPVAIDAPGGFLMEWWSVFWDVFVARATEKNPESASSPAGQQKFPQQQPLAPQQREKRHQQIPKQKHSQQQFSRGIPDTICSRTIAPKRQKTASANAMATKIYEERLKLPLHMELQKLGNSPTNLLEPYQLHMMKSAAVSGTRSGQRMHGMSRANSGQLHQGIKSELNSASASRSTRLGDPLFLMNGSDQGMCSLPLKGWPLTGLDQLQSGLHTQQQSLNELQLQQQLMLQAQQATLASSSDLEAYTLRMLLNSTGNFDPNLGRPVLPNTASSLQYSSHVLTIEDMDALIMHLLNSEQQQNLYLHSPRLGQQAENRNNLMQQEQLFNYGVTTGVGFPNALMANDQAIENVIRPKREQHLPVAGPTKSVDTTNIPGSSSSSLSTLSAHILGQATSFTSKASSMFGTDTMELVKAPTTQLAEMDRAVDNGSSKEHAGSPLSLDDMIRSNVAGLDNQGKGCEGFSLKEFHHLPGGQGKVECCDFSSDGKYLVFGGYDRRATLWRTESFALTSKLEEHSMWITDVRFSPSMPRLATSSADKTVRIWDVDHPGFSIRTFTGHSSPVMSLDFHPGRDDLICSSDCDNEIRYWSIKSSCCSGVLKGGANHMRFQPRFGRFLAAAAENVVSLLDVESQVCRQKLQGHKSTIHNICWDSSGYLLSSVSDDLVRVWAIGSNVKGELVHELHSSGNKFRSCVFHPTNPSVLIIGSYQTIELWDMKGERKTTLHAHEKLVSCLAASDIKGFIASVSYDKCVKIWK